MAFDTIILRREWENSSSAAVPFFWVCFQMEHESEIWLLFSSWFYTTDLSRAFCLSETFIVPPCLSVALFLPFADLCRFIVFHIPEPCLAIPFPYLSCCQQGFFFFFFCQPGFITANTEKPWCLCCWIKSSATLMLWPSESCVMFRVKGTKCQGGGPGSVAADILKPLTWH